MTHTDEHDGGGRPLALVTGASRGIGFELAKCCAQGGFDLLIAADEPEILEAATVLREYGVRVDAVAADLATKQGVDRLCAAANARPIEALLANASHGLGRAVLDQGFDEIRHVIDTNITGTVYLVQKVVREMRRRTRGRILLTGSLAGVIPGTLQAVYDGTKAFIHAFASALGNEMKDTSITVTCLMRGATGTDFFRRADADDADGGATRQMDDPADAARDGFEAMMKGEGDVVSGWKKTGQSSMANITPATVLAEQHRKLVDPE